MQYDVCIIGGCGHVGLPLGIAFADKGKKVCIQDINNSICGNSEIRQYAVHRRRRGGFA
jgi:UDP-N-acetyl-D-mannosaminuronate dehydrogenase